jgi:predicted transposase YbfD/YdcC
VDVAKPTDGIDAAFDPHKRAKEFQERQRSAWELDVSNSTITTTATGAAASITKPEKRNSWTTDELLSAASATAPSDAKPIAPSTTTTKGKPSNQPQSQPTNVPTAPKTGSVATEEIPMCILSSKSYTKDSGVYNSSIGERFLSACIILDIPERARSGGNMEAMDVQLGLGAFDITAGNVFMLSL